MLTTLFEQTDDPIFTTYDCVFPPILFFRRVNADKDTLSDVRVHLKVHHDF